MASESQLNALLSSPDFSVATYLNHAIQLSEEKQNHDHEDQDADTFALDEEEEQRIMAELALHLQVQTQGCHDEIGRIGAELRAILPRCAADLGRLQVGLDGMRDDAGSLLESHLQSSLENIKITEDKEHPGPEGENGKDDIQEGVRMGMDEHEEDGGKGDMNTDKENMDPSLMTDATMTPLETLETLSTLHALQQNLATTKEILTAASTYHSTLQTISSLMAGNANANTDPVTGAFTPSSSTNTSTIHQAVSSLATLEAGARALSGLPGKSQRHVEITTIRNQILTLLKPVLLHALNKVETRLGPLQTCVAMYGSLNNMERLMEEYVKSRPGVVHKLWFGFRKSGNLGRSNAAKRETNELEFYSDDDDDHGNDEEDDDAEGMGMGRDASISTHEENQYDNQEDPSKAFGTWLPSWYESVLLLLGEERRRAHAVFGPDLAPEIMVKVLNECFRPIQSSFSTRLNAICPKGDGLLTSNSSSGKRSASFDVIARAYQATLQFLSVAYEQLGGFDDAASIHDEDEEDEAAAAENKEGGTQTEDSATKSHNPLPRRTKTPVQLHMMARSILVSIASPFAPYQTNFATLEMQHSDMTARMVSSDIRHAVSGRVTNLASLQDSVAKLAGLAPFMFPLAQASLARFGSLNGGFGALNALETIDTILEGHMEELAISFNTLSSNVLNDNNDHISSSSSMEAFDEQQVQSALEVLKIAGVVRKELSALEERTRDQFRILAGRMASTIEQESTLTDAVVNGVTSASAVPVSLSVVEVEVLLATAVCGADEDRDTSKNKSPSVTMVQQLANADIRAGEVRDLFPKAIDATTKLVKSCQSFVFDICAFLPFRNMDPMPSMTIWGQEESMWASAAITADSYGTLPQSYITHVGEHMLALVQALEPFSSNEEALSLANGVMEGVDHVADSSWREYARAIHCSESSSNEEVFISLLKKGTVLKEFVLGNMHHSFDEDGNGDDYDEDEDSADEFCNKWLDAVCSAVTGKLLERTMRIPKLSRKGCEHLSVDYNYIINVLSALGVSGHPHPLLGHMAELSSMDAESLQARILGSEDDEFGIRKAEIRIALMRGIPID